LSGRLIELRTCSCRFLQAVVMVAAAMLVVVAGIATHAQSTATPVLPDAPQTAVEVDETSGQQTTTAPAQQPASASVPSQQNSAGQNGAAQNTSGTQTSAEQTQREKAEEEVKEQEKQRVEGIVPTFNVTYHHDAVPLTPGQKMNLSLHSCLDPFTFASAFLEAGYHEAANDLSGFDWGIKGYGERVGVAYADSFDGTILSNGVVPIIFRQDPRYFRLGVGPARHRILYSLSTSFIAKNDYNGKWGPNYGNLLGNLAAGGISNFYYPAGNSGVRITFTTFAIQIAEGAGGAMFDEFWPDLSRKMFHKDPSHGLDAQAAEEYKAHQQQQLQHQQTADPTTPPRPSTSQ
jgi:hypothetical protein